MNGLINNAHTLITKGNKNDISNINVLIEDTINQLVLHKNIHNINQFYPVFIIFLDRLYGEDINFQYDNAATSSTGGSSSISTKGSAGGWLKALVETTSEVYSSSSSSSSNNSRYYDNSQYALKTSYLDTVSSSTQRLLKFFIPTTSLLLDLLNKSQSRFELNIAMLPSKLQMYLNEHPAVISFNSSNLDQICHHLLLYPLHSTLQVRYLYTLPICIHTYIHNVILATHCIPSTTYVNNIPVDSLFILSIYHTSFPSLNIS